MDKSKTHSVKQVLFVVVNQRQQIIPVQIIEKHIKQTLQGDEVVYKVRDPKGEKIYDLQALKGEMYSNPVELKRLLKERISESIDKMVEQAVKIAKLKFGYTESMIEDQNSLDSLVQKDEYELDFASFSDDSSAAPQTNVLPHKASSNDTLEILDQHGNPKQVKVRKVVQGEPR